MQKARRFEKQSLALWIGEKIAELEKEVFERTKKNAGLFCSTAQKRLLLYGQRRVCKKNSGSARKAYARKRGGVEYFSSLCISNTSNFEGWSCKSNLRRVSETEKSKQFPGSPSGCFPLRTKTGLQSCRLSAPNAKSTAPFSQIWPKTISRKFRRQPPKRQKKQ